MKSVKIIFSCLFIAILGSLAFAQDGLKVHLIDIGEGDAILIQAKNDNALIDTGHVASVDKLIHYLKKTNVKKIKYLIITHPHFDHFTGISDILPEFEVEAIYDNGQVLIGRNELEKLYGALVRTKGNYHVLRAGGILKLDGNVILEALWPITMDKGSYNENSLVIRLTYNNFSCLLVGDLNKVGEGRLLKENLNLKAKILKVGHHGNPDATSQDFLEAVSPEAALVSVASWMPFDTVAGSLKKRDIKVFRTDRDGDIVISVNPQGQYKIEASKR